MKQKKRGLSPVITTVLLIALVVIIALLIFLWAKKFVGEAVEKGGVSAEQKCGEINLEASVSEDGQLSVINRGNVPIYSLEVKKISPGSKDSETLEAINLGAGATQIYDITPGDAEEFKILPVLMGETKSNSQKTYPCDKVLIDVEKEY